MKYWWCCLLFLFFGCSTGKEPIQVLRISIPSEPATLDPKKSADFISSTIATLLYEGLMRCESGSQIKPALAEKVDLSADGKRYTFHLRSSFWSDGSPVTAHDFERSWKAVLHHSFPSPSKYLFFPIKNAEPFAKGLCTEQDVGIFASDAKTLQVELENATPYFLSLTAFPLYLPTHPNLDIRNGPFLLQKTQLGSLILQKNPLFWNRSLILLEKICVSIIPEKATALKLFEQGDLDLIGGPLVPLAIDDIMHIQTEPLFLPMDASTFCVFNTALPPFSNPHLRKALLLAVYSNAALKQEILELGHIPAEHALPPALDLLDDPITTSSQAAKELLQRALCDLNWKQDDLDSITLYCHINPVEKKMALLLQKIWKETLGISIHIQQMEQKTLMHTLHHKNFHISFASWVAQLHDPINILERFKDPKGAKNYACWNNPIFQELLAKANATTDPSKRRSLLHQAEQVLEEDAILIPLYHWNSPFLIASKVKGLQTTSSGGVLLDQCCINTECRSSVQHH